MIWLLALLLLLLLLPSMQALPGWRVRSGAL
jgi:hypothetical protein